MWGAAVDRLPHRIVLSQGSWCPATSVVRVLTPDFPSLRTSVRLSAVASCAVVLVELGPASVGETTSDAAAPAGVLHVIDLVFVVSQGLPPSHGEDSFLVGRRLSAWCCQKPLVEWVQSTTPIAAAALELVQARFGSCGKARLRWVRVWGPRWTLVRWPSRFEGFRECPPLSFGSLPRCCESR